MKCFVFTILLHLVNVRGLQHTKIGFPFTIRPVFVPKFYPILDVATIANRGMDVLAAAEQILDGGARILQFRHKNFISRDVYVAAQAIAEMCRRAGAMFVVNDRADVARLLGAALHLGQDDLAPADARKVTGSESRIGFSTHNEQQMRAAANEPVDYIAFGPIFGTVSKHNPDPCVGLEQLRRVRALTDRPLVAIGGITRANAPSVLEAGADSVAVIGDVFPEDGDIRARVQEWIRLL
jgi:thiamine-phosphate pyrophosphorylase